MMYGRMVDDGEVYPTASPFDFIAGGIAGGIRTLFADVADELAPTFANAGSLYSHFMDHFMDFGATSPAQYQDMAADFLTRDLEPGVLQGIRGNGDIVRFNTTTDEFGVLSGSGNIRTYFTPSPTIHGLPTNLDYFNSQF